MDAIFPERLSVDQICSLTLVPGVSIIIIFSSEYIPEMSIIDNFLDSKHPLLDLLLVKAT